MNCFFNKHNLLQLVKCSICLFMLIESFLFTYAYAANKYDETVYHVQRKLYCTKEQAEAFLQYVDGVATSIQENFSSITSHKTSKYNKKRLMKETIENFFEDEHSLVQASTINSKRIKTCTIKRYLERLASGIDGRYTKVKIYFDPNYLSLGSINSYIDREYGKTYSFRLSVWQIFVGYLGEDIKYEDATQKDLIFIFHKDKNSGYWALKVQSIVAKETVDMEQFGKIKDKWK